MSEQENRQEKNEIAPIDITSVIDDLWKGVLHLWWLLLAIVAVFTLCFFCHAKISYEPYYQASSTYTVNTSQIYGDSDTYYRQPTAEELGVSLQYILTSDVMEAIVAEELGRNSMPGEISVEVLEGTSLITIRASAADAQTAYDILQAVIENYPRLARRVIGDTVLEAMDETGVPAAPANSSNAGRAARKGFLAGICVAFVVLLFFSLSKRTVKKEEDLQKLLNVKCMGVIPRARFKKRGKQKDGEATLVLIDNYRIPAGFVESMRSVRTRIEKDHAEKKHKVYMITSAIPGEGKSTVAVNIAMSLAAGGKSVILVDMDLRNPSLLSCLGSETGEYGCCDLLKQDAALRDVLLQYKNSKMFVIPGGKPMNNTSELLSGESLKVLIQKLSRLADYVILDTPPCSILSDASLVASCADAAVFVTRQDYGRVDRILEGVENLAETRIPICGCILNAAEVGVTGYGYGNRYGYGRYGYGYGDRKYGYGYGGYGYGYGMKKKKEI